MAQMAVAVNKEVTRVPKFSIETLKGERKRERRTWDAKKKSFVDGVQIVEGGFLLKFPKGHSIVVDSMKEVYRLVGDPENIEIVDLENSDVVGVRHVPLNAKEGE